MFNKKLLALLLTLTMLFAFVTTPAHTTPYDSGNEAYYQAVSQLVASRWEDTYFSKATLATGGGTLEVDGRVIALNNKAEIQNGGLMLPAEVFETLGARISYGTHDVLIEKKGHNIEIAFGEKTMKVNGHKKGLATAAALKNGKPVLPASVLSELGGFEVAYNEVSGEITITNEFQTARVLAKVMPGKAPPPDIAAVQTITGPDGLYIYQFDSEEQAKTACSILNANDSIEFAEADKYYFLNIEPANAVEKLIPEAAYSHLGWGAVRIDADRYMDYLIARGKQNAAVTVAVLDTGLDITHPYFAGRHVPGRNFINPILPPNDGNGHGTHVSGTVVDVTIAMPNVKIMPLKVLNDSAQGTSSILASAITWAADNGAKVINMSLYGDHTSAIDNAVAYAAGKKVVSVAAAGNFGVDAYIYCPAHIGAVITVSAEDSTDQPASFSNHGTCVDVAAPGVNIVSTIPGGGYGSMRGTSMSCPHVSGAAALLLCDDTALSPQTIKTLICANVDPLVRGNNTNHYGSGILNIGKAVTDFIPGDIDGDGRVTLTDLSLLAQYFIGGYGIEERYPLIFTAGDMDRNGKLDQNDLLLLTSLIINSRVMAREN